MRSFLFSVFRIARRLIAGKSGRGLGRVPVIGWAYRRLYHLLKPHGITQVKFYGLSIHVDADDPTHAALLLGTDYNDPEIALCREVLAPGMLAVDVGANIGCFTVVMARAVGETGRVFAFEPEPSNFGLLQRNVETNGLRNVTMIEKAVGEKVVKTELYLSREASGDHRLYDGGEGRASVPVQVTSLDAFFGADPPTVDLVKIDVQGAEASVLRGMGRLLAASPDARLLVEFDPWSLKGYGDDPTTFLRELDALGYSLHHVVHGSTGRRPLYQVTPEEACAICEAEGRHINLFCVRGRGVARRAVRSKGTAE